MAFARSIKSPQRLMRLMGIQVDGTGTASISEGQFDATLVDNGTGDYTITFNEAYARTPTISALTLTADAILQIAAVSTTSVQINAFDATDGTTAKDVDFHLMVYGSDTADEI